MSSELSVKNAEPMLTDKFFIVSNTFIFQLIDYLGKQPYNEVYHLIQSLHDLNQVNIRPANEVDKLADKRNEPKNGKGKKK